MPNIFINKTSVDALPPDGKWHADNKLTGFWVRRSPKGKVSYGVHYYLHRREKCRVFGVNGVVGWDGEITPEKARRRAKQLLGMAANGIDPFAEKTRARDAPMKNRPVRSCQRRTGCRTRWRLFPEARERLAP